MLSRSLGWVLDCETEKRPSGDGEAADDDVKAGIGSLVGTLAAALRSWKKASISSLVATGILYSSSPSSQLGGMGRASSYGVLAAI